MNHAKGGKGGVQGALRDGANISFEYRLVGNYLKENIIIKEKSALEPFRFALNTNGMTAELQEDRSVLISSGTKEEPSFLMNAPFMYDAAGARTSQVEVTLTETENGYLYTMTPSGNGSMILSGLSGDH